MKKFSNIPKVKTPPSQAQMGSSRQKKDVPHFRSVAHLKQLPPPVWDILPPPLKKGAGGISGLHLENQEIP